MLVKLGTITKQIGLKGELKIYSTTDFAKTRYKKGNKVLIPFDNEYKEFIIHSYRKIDNNFDAITLENYLDINLTNDFLKKDIFADKDELKLKKNEFFYCDLEGCEVYFDNNKVGEVIKVEEFPAQITLNCKSIDDKEFFIPFIDVFINNVDIINKIIDVNLIEGML